MSNGSATCCAQVPMFESRLATQNVPNRLVPSRRSESPSGGAFSFKAVFESRRAIFPAQ